MFGPTVCSPQNVDYLALSGSVYKYKEILPKEDQRSLAKEHKSTKVFYSQESIEIIKLPRSGVPRKI